MILTALTRISDMCPTQWTATNERGEPVYIRYRFDTLTVHCPFDKDDTRQEYDAFMAAQILEMRNVTGEPYRGVMEDEEMLAHTGYTVAEIGHAETK